MQKLSIPSLAEHVRHSPPEAPRSPHVAHGREQVRRDVGRVTAAPHVPKPETYVAGAGESRKEFLDRRRAEETELQVRTPEELIAAMEANPYMKAAFYQAVRALPDAEVPAEPAAPKRGVLSRIGGWLKRQVRDIADDVAHPTGFVKKNDWAARKAEVARRILGAPELKVNRNLYGEYVIAAAERMGAERADAEHPLAA